MAYKIDFAELKQRVSIEQGAQMLGLTLTKHGHQLRGKCPACGNEDERILAITPDRGMFYCFSAKKGGDVISLVQHITGLELQEAAQFLVPSGSDNSPMPTPKGNTSHTGYTFDPDKFAAKLQYTPEVAALGLTEEEAARLLVGHHPQRKAMYFGLRNPDGSISGFIKVDGKIVPPPQWISSNVVALKRA